MAQAVGTSLGLRHHWTRVACAVGQDELLYAARVIRSERDSNHRWAFPPIPHFQVSGRRCRDGHRRASRIQILVVEGTMRQAKAPALGLRWVWICRLSGPAMGRDGHLR
jgi:hypothetical protein